MLELYQRISLTKDFPFSVISYQLSARDLKFIVMLQLHQRIYLTKDFPKYNVKKSHIAMLIHAVGLLERR
ncbi:MAG: hypothetical protein F6K40_27970 [Okeania sp. SIO3I5]|uniref:hypothetical protein n=1 Tax=Okeania sp. SIO3I5 TaxID=2607805 RepID=UPI0013BE07BD|nr:hypothetical protein [Okeania sp. SIO3I5]NEQ39878.1 hypothetical protein [Okeania sp. SIO3I5]